MSPIKQELFNKLAHFFWDHTLDADKEDEFLNDLREAGQATLADEFEAYKRTDAQRANPTYDKW